MALFLISIKNNIDSKYIIKKTVLLSLVYDYKKNKPCKFNVYSKENKFNRLFRLNVYYSYNIILQSFVKLFDLI